MFAENLESTDLKTQVVKAILHYIRAMDLQKDNKLPREEEFCKLLGTSRVTLRAALDVLDSQGFIFRRHGKGTFVNTRSLDIKVSFNPVMDFYDMIAFSGYEPSVRLLESEQIPVPSWLQEAMEVEETGREVFHTRKLFYADKKFCAYTEDYLNIGCLSNPQHLRDVSFASPVFPMLDREFGICIEWDKVEIDVALCDQVQGLSNVETGREGYPLLLLRGMNYDCLDRPVLYIKEYIDTSLIQFNQIRKRSMTLSIGRISDNFN